MHFACHLLGRHYTVHGKLYEPMIEEQAGNSRSSQRRGLCESVYLHSTLLALALASPRMPDASGKTEKHSSSFQVRICPLVVPASLFCNKARLSSVPRGTSGAIRSSRTSGLRKSKTIKHKRAYALHTLRFCLPSSASSSSDSVTLHLSTSAFLHHLHHSSTSLGAGQDTISASHLLVILSGLSLHLSCPLSCQALVPWHANSPVLWQV